MNVLNLPFLARLSDLFYHKQTQALCAQSKAWFSPLYSWPVHILVAIGCAAWLVAYIVIIRKMIKHKFVEMPLFVACGNIAWEFVWSGAIFSTNQGLIFQLGYAGWLILDVIIFIYVFKYGYKNVFIEELKPRIKLWTCLLIFGWGVLFYTMGRSSLENCIGSISAYPLNLGISLLYITQLFRLPNPMLLSKTVAWMKMIGTGLISIANYLIYPQNSFIPWLGLWILILDIAYIVLLNRYQKAYQQTQAADNASPA